MTSNRPEIEEGTLIVPYARNQAIITFEQDDDKADLFIRAKLHPDFKVWYADCSEDGNLKHAAAGYEGLVVFVTRQVQPNELIRVTRVFQNKLSAKGTILKAPADLQTPFDYEYARVKSAGPR